AADLFDPYGRPARRTQWIVSTLAYHYGLDRGVENEIIVLATGLDQYLQEIFHHMDYQGGGKIPVEDFKALCEVLELSEDAGDAGSAGGSERLPDQLTFRHFHARLCGYFSSQAGRRYEKGRLLVQRDSEHIETQIRLRSPLRRREKPLCAGPSSAAGRHEDRISKLEDENASLRELIEDMRAALQSSDARCLALQVGLLKSQSKHKPEAGCLELRRWKEAAAALEERNQSLRREQADMRRKVEEARQAIVRSVKKVKELESRASQVPALQRHIRHLEAQIRFRR
uniref:EF-hand and coiled-coil domain containing 1 n=1 Tax=Tetraodon nigroviridis TaxID=99883 RepID=H3CPL2_TETNG